MILPTMLARLHASLARGPGLNARPHRSRQRIDLCELEAFRGTAPATALATIMGPPARPVEFPARVPAFRRPDSPDTAWTEAQRLAAGAAEHQARLLGKLRDIATDATDYFNDHGEDALFLGFPLLSLPAQGEQADVFRQKALLAPVMLLPVTLRVRLGPRPGVTLEPRGDGADLVLANPALLAWIEQQTGVDTDELFADESGEDPWREMREVLALVGRATGLDEHQWTFSPETVLQPVPRTDALPPEPALLPGAVLGLFPLTNPGLVRDTKWMIEHEAELRLPARSFVTPEVLRPPAPADAAVPEPPPSEPPPQLSDQGEVNLVAKADPCQAAAVACARSSSALVIHGPPGTGKSQTITNIIGDHLSRGERVLLVCDKRTALDVVKYRLDGMGLGGLCGVIHDPQYDRRNLYLGLRERLEALTEQEPVADPSRSLQRLTTRVQALDAELRSAFESLHRADAEGASFHEQVGRWLELTSDGVTELPEAEELSAELLANHRADAEEVLLRAGRSRWHENPYRGRVGMTLGQWLALAPGTVERQLEASTRLAAKADDLRRPEIPPLDPGARLELQAEQRRAIADTMRRLVRAGEPDVAAVLAAGLTLDEQTAFAALEQQPSGALAPLDQELVLQLGGSWPALAELNARLTALDTWSEFGSGLRGWFAFAEKKAAAEALAPLGLPRAPEAVQRARMFYQGLKARWLWSVWWHRKLGRETHDLLKDERLVQLRQLLELVNELREQLAATKLPSLPSAVWAMCGKPVGTAEVWITALVDTAEQAEALLALREHLDGIGLFTAEALASEVASWCGGGSAQGSVSAWLDAAGTLDEVIRLTERLTTTPEGVATCALAAARIGMSWPEAQRAFERGVLAGSIRRRLRHDPVLAQVDSQRVEAAFNELGERLNERQVLVRSQILHLWDGRMRARLVATGGQRLTPLAAALRTRLLVRGKRALKLRQMIAAGAEMPGGDPLFDVCPVWMASPATVAQIFPREPLFDVVVFDEASQCRLEEALPVLLRGKRVVVAGDPRQLPPTRFFEQGFAESDEGSAETAEEVFVQQQSEAEDLLTAALNLDVRQAYLDVHYRSRHQALIGYSNEAFYGGRLQPLPVHPGSTPGMKPIQLVRVDGTYGERGNPAEAKEAAKLVRELLARAESPSIGIACFNLPQRDLILDALDELADADPAFAEQLRQARERRGRDSFEGLFVKNLENVQGDERDHMIISTTFGPDKGGKFRRNFGALSQPGGERRLNVLVTRAREQVHVLTSIPRDEYSSVTAVPTGTGRHHLYGYLNYSERASRALEVRPDQPRPEVTRCIVQPTAQASAAARSVGRELWQKHGVGSIVHWGNEGFMIDVALHSRGGLTVGVLIDFNRYRRTPDSIAWELFRTGILRDQGWQLQRLWTPQLFRDLGTQLAAVSSYPTLRREKAATDQADGSPKA